MPEVDLDFRRRPKPVPTPSEISNAPPFLSEIPGAFPPPTEATPSDADLDARRRSHIYAARPVNATQDEYWKWHDQLYLGGSWQSPEWRQRVREVRHRDGYRCVECGAKGPEIELHTDHIIPLSEFGSNELDNLKTLCIDCHEKKTGRPLRSRRRE